MPEAAQVFATRRPPLGLAKKHIGLTGLFAEIAFERELARGTLGHGRHDAYLDDRNER
jgi:hypothetical protein